MKKIYFIEGIPGSGKTTLSQVVERMLIQKNKVVKRYEEHSCENPLDVTRKAFLSQTEYTHFLRKCIYLSQGSKYTSDDIVARIKTKTVLANDYAVISYLQPYFADQAIARELQQLYSKEICNGCISEKEYMDIVSSMFLRFSKNAKDGYVYVFDGALFQNILLDMVGFYNCSISVLKHFYSKLFSALTAFEVVIIFLYSENIDALLNATNNDRTGMNWLSKFNTWSMKTNWFQMCKDVSTYSNGAVDFSCNLQQTMLELMDSFTEISKCLIKARYTTLDLKGVI